MICTSFIPTHRLFSVCIYISCLPFIPARLQLPFVSLFPGESNAQPLSLKGKLMSYHSCCHWSSSDHVAQAAALRWDAESFLMAFGKEKWFLLPSAVCSAWSPRILWPEEWKHHSREIGPAAGKEGEVFTKPKPFSQVSTWLWKCQACHKEKMSCPWFRPWPEPCSYSHPKIAFLLQKTEKILL